jgi:hypothetical protein
MSQAFCNLRCVCQGRSVWQIDKRGVDLISDALPFGRLGYGEPNAVSNAIGYAEHRSRSHDAVIRVYDAAGNVIETHEYKGDFKEPSRACHPATFYGTLPLWRQK